MKYKVIEYWLRNNYLSVNAISSLLSVNAVLIDNWIKEYNQQPYFILESKINKQ